MSWITNFQDWSNQVSQNISSFSGSSTQLNDVVGNVADILSGEQNIQMEQKMSFDNKTMMYIVLILLGAWFLIRNKKIND